MKRIFFLILLAVMSTGIYAQTDDKGYKEGAWVLNGVTGLNLSQTAMTNWSAGGENALSGNAYLNGSLTHKNGNWLWVTNLILDYGLSKTKSQGMRKTTDKIGLSTQLGYSTNNVWYYTLMGDLNTQFAKGYNYPDKTHYISNFFAPAYSNISLGIYVIKRTLLIKLLENAIPKGYYDFVKDIILRNKDKIDIYGYEFDGYWNTLNSVNSYMETNMDFLNKDVRKILTQEPFIASKPSDDPPAKYNPTAEVTNTLVGTGSIIDGNVKNSVLFRKVFVGEGATVENSVIMKSSYIGKGCVIKNAIIDKEVVISDNKEVIGTEEEPIVIGKGQVI